MTPRWTENEINASLDLRAAIQEFPAYMDRFAEWSLAACGRFAPVPIAYGASADEYVMEAVPAPQLDRRALTVFIHGGYWRAYSAGDFFFMGEPWLKDGDTFLSINYGLCPSVSMRELTGQVMEALRSIALRHPGRAIRLVGHSAGAHLAMLACCLPWWRSIALSATPVCEAVLISGLYDLEPVSRSFLQEVLRLSADEVADFSPLHLEADPAVKYRLLAGERETGLFKQQSQALLEKLSSQGADAICSEAAAADHFSVLEADLLSAGRWA